MKNYFLCLFALIIPLFSSWECLWALPSSGLLIQNVSVISPHNFKVQKKRDVLIQGDRIQKIQKRILPTSNERVYDGQGLFLVPGLIDAHVHLKGIPGMALGDEEEYPELAKKYYQQLPKSYLYFGFTTVIDLAVVDRKFIDQFKSEPIRPDVYDCDGPLPIANGYPMVFLPEKTRFNWFWNFLYDEQQAKSIPTRFKKQDHTPEAAIKRVKQAGGICVKTFIEDGWGPNKWPLIPKKTMKEVLHHAHKRKLPVLAHANSYRAHKMALDLGVDVVVHGMWNWEKHDGKKWLSDNIREVLNGIVEKRIGFISTMRVMSGIRTVFDLKFLQDPNLKHVLPVALIQWYKTPEGQAFRKELIEEDPRKKDFKRALKLFNIPVRQGRKVVRYIARNKGHLLFGSDTPSSPTYGNPPGYNGYLELKAMAEAGVSLKKIFQAATLSNAKEFGLEKDFGSVEPQKAANLLLLKKNPLRSIKAYDSIEAVIVRGKLHNRSLFSAASRGS